MSSTRSPSHVCSFIPPYMLRHIADSQHVEQHVSASARTTLDHTLSFQSHRLAHPPTTRTARSGFIPPFLQRSVAASEQADGETNSKPSEGLEEQKLLKKDTKLHVQREVHDANHSTDPSTLPGTLVTSDANPSVASVEKTVTDCFENLGAVYDFYAKVFKRNSIDGNGLVLIGSVHFGNNYENAFWNGSEMVFGDGGTFLNNFTKSLDVVGHELTHGVTENTAALVYEGQSGALNESISDVFGSMIRQYKYKETVDEADWLIGEDCILPDIKGLALRSMKAPGTAYDDPRIGKDPQGGHMKYFQNLPDTDDGDNGGVHINSGIPNRAFYLVATGLGGHSWEKAGPIWYNTINSKEINNKCDFAQFANITINVAKKLYGDKESQVVRDAWTTVGVLE